MNRTHTIIRLGLLMLLGMGHPATAVEVLTPEQERATFQLADGFQANLFASEELGVLNPMQMRWDAEGRLYVISTLAYPQLRPGEIPNDKIIRLEDTDGDGRADRSVVFADGLNIPTGLEVGDGGIYVGEQTDLVFLKDTDGDGKADVRKVILSGFGVGDTHQAINSFVWSPGGELLINQGDGIESRVETPWGVSGLFQAGVMRLRPRRLQLDPFLDDFMGPGNPWGVAFDDWGQTFVVDGAGGITFLSPAMMPVHHKRRLRQIGKPGGYCGIDMLGSRHLPDEFQGDYILGDFQQNRIRRYATVPNGAGFEVQWKEPIVVSRHRNFRPVDVRTGPDGAIYICDWYNSVICHQDDPFRHPDRDFTHGRIWRISRTDREPVPLPELRNAKTIELFKHLASPERWIRYQAKRVLAQRSLDEEWAAGLRDELMQLLGDHPDEHLLFEVIGALESTETVVPELLQRLVNAEDYRARAYAARVVGRWHDRMPGTLALLETLAHDSHSQVRMEAAVACAHVPNAHAAEVVAILADQEMDYDVDYAFSQALHHLKELWVPAFERGELSFGGRANRIAAVLERVSTSELLSIIRDLAKSPSAEPNTRFAILKTLARVGNEDDLANVLQAALKPAAMQHELLDELHATFESSARKPSGSLQPIAQLFESDKPAVRNTSLLLAGLWQERGLVDQLETISTNANNEPTTLHAAILALGHMRGERADALLRKLGTGGNQQQQFSAAIALSQDDPDFAARQMASVVKTHALDTDQITSLLHAFAARDGGLDQLAQQLDAVGLSAETSTRVLNVLNATGLANDNLLELLNRAAGISLSLPDYSKELVERLVSQIPGGDAERGAQIFHSQQTNCNKCHQIRGIGGQIGPELSGVGTTMPKDRLVQEVMWPQRHVKDGYQLEQVLTEDGEIFQGYMQKSRDRKHYYLRPLNAENVMRIAKKDVDEHDVVGSAMPENIVAALTPQQRIDLLAFLSQLGTPDGITGLPASRSDNQPDTAGASK